MMVITPILYFLFPTSLLGAIALMVTTASLDSEFPIVSDGNDTIPDMIPVGRAMGIDFGLSYILKLRLGRLMSLLGQGNEPID